MADEETNYYLVDLRDAKARIEPAKDAIWGGMGTDAGLNIASNITGGGWQCPAADDWVEDLSAKTKKILPAFDDAQRDLQTAINNEPDQVPKDHPHGNAWRRTHPRGGGRPGGNIPI